MISDPARTRRIRYTGIYLEVDSAKGSTLEATNTLRRGYWLGLPLDTSNDDDLKASRRGVNVLWAYLFWPQWSLSSCKGIWILTFSD